MPSIKELKTAVVLAQMFSVEGKTECAAGQIKKAKDLINKIENGDAIPSGFDQLKKKLDRIVLQ